MNAYSDCVENFRYYIVVTTKYFKSYWGQHFLIMEQWPEKKGIKTVIGELNRALRQFNQMFISLMVLVSSKTIFMTGKTWHRMCAPCIPRRNIAAKESPDTCLAWLWRIWKQKGSPRSICWQNMLAIMSAMAGSIIGISWQYRQQCAAADFRVSGCQELSRSLCDYAWTEQRKRPHKGRATALQKPCNLLNFQVGRAILYMWYAKRAIYRKVHLSIIQKRTVLQTVWLY